MLMSTTGDSTIVTDGLGVAGHAAVLVVGPPVGDWLPPELAAQVARLPFSVLVHPLGAWLPPDLAQRPAWRPIY